MFITDAFAQVAPAAPSGIFGGGDIIGFMLPMVAIMGVFYFFMIRPQQQKLKETQNMLSQVSRGDTIITHGGLIGKVVRVVDDRELLVEIGEGVKVRVLRQGIADIPARGEPAKAEAIATVPKSKKK